MEELVIGGHTILPGKTLQIEIRLEKWAEVTFELARTIETSAEFENGD